MTSTSCILRERKNYASSKAYADAVREWMSDSQRWIADQQRVFYENLGANGIQAAAAGSQAQPTVLIGHGHQQAGQPGRQPGVLQAAARRVMFRIGLNRNGPASLQTFITQEYVIPSFWRRICAEMIDFLFMFFFKVIIVYMMVEMEMLDLQQYTKLFADDVDINNVIDLTQDLVHLELISRTVCAFFEAYWISYDCFMTPAGCSPGKYFMRIQVISAVNITPVAGTNDRITVTRLISVPYFNSLVRAFVKGGFFTAVFPLNIFLCFFPFNRAIHDIAAKTVVVCF